MIEALCEKKMEYRASDLFLSTALTSEEIFIATKKALELFNMVGVKTENHFKLVYLALSDNNMIPDYQFSKEAFKWVVLSLETKTVEVAKLKYSVSELI